MEKKGEDVDVGKRRGRGEDGGPSAPLKENISPLYIRFNYGIATKLIKNEGQTFTALAPDSKQVGQKEFWGAHMVSVDPKAPMIETPKASRGGQRSMPPAD